LSLLDAADEFDEDVEVLAVGERQGVGGEKGRIDARAGLLRVAHRDADDLERCGRRVEQGNVARFIAQQLDEGAAHKSSPNDSDANFRRVH